MEARVAVPLALAAVALAAGAFVAAGGVGMLLETDGYQPVTPTGGVETPGTATTGGASDGASDGTATTGGTAPATATTPPTATAASAGDGSSATPTRAPTERTFDDGYERATVTVRAENGTRLGRLRVALAETYRQKYTGLSNTERLPPDRGMLFVYDEPGNHTYVMREMSFGIDIVYVDSDGTITRIHHAPEPPPGTDGNSFRYPGYGQYVLEVNLNWTTRHGVGVGDRIEIDRGG